MRQDYSDVSALHMQVAPTRETGLLSGGTDSAGQGLRRPEGALKGPNGFVGELPKAEADESLRRLAGLDPELRTQLHVILGNVQLLRLDAGGTALQTQRLDAMLAAGKRLLEKVEDLNLLSARDASFSPSRLPTDADPVRASHAALQLNVLVADDVEMNRDIATALLRGAGHAVAVAEDGAEAVALASTAEFDVILMDVRMPGMDGLEATRRIRALGGRYGRVPIIALTAKASPEEAASCRAAGMNAHLAKPFRHDTLLEGVERVVAARDAHDGDTLARAQAADGPANMMSADQLRAMIAPRTTAAENGHMGAGWVDIVSPWRGSQPATQAELQPEVQLEPKTAHGAAAPIANFTVKLKRRLSGNRNTLIDAHISCAPPPEKEGEEFHWLMFVEPGTEYPDKFTSECELWRWHRNSWRSVAVPGARFSPDDMYRDGWRYCGTCDAMTVRAEIVA